MIGLAVLAGIAIYVGIWWFVVRFLKQRWAKSLAILLAIAIPLGDLPFGYFNFLRHCDYEGGVRQVERISPHKSVFFLSVTGVKPQYLFRLGADFVEYSSSDGGVIRFTKLP